MANEDTAFREVDQELAEERQWAMFQKFGPLIIGGAVAIVVAVGGWQFWNARQNDIAKQQALEFNNAVELLAENEADGRVALKAISDESASGYSILAAMHRAASFSRSGERLSAVEAFRDIYNNNAAPRHVRDLARVRAAYLSLSDGRDDVMQDLGDLAQSGGAYAFHAQEVTGLAALDAEDYETALSVFRQLSIDLGAPPAIRERAEDFAALAASGKAGVNIKGEAQLDDILSAIGERGPEGVGIVDDHEGHDHEAGASEEELGEESFGDSAEPVEDAAEPAPVTDEASAPSPENSENE